MTSDDSATAAENFPFDSNVRIVFGLEAQGHIPTIEASIKEGADWAEIGRRISWDGETARAYYQRYLVRSKQ
jgi:hypothetical protein